MIRRLVYTPDRIEKYMERYGVSEKEAIKMLEDEYEDYCEQKYQESRDKKL